MKTKLALLLGCLVATAVHAASIDWTVSGKNQALTEFDGTTIAKETTVYLILADTVSLESITDVASESAFTTALNKILIGSVQADTAGKKPNPTTTRLSSSLLEAGSTYTMASIYLSKDTDGNGVYKIATGTGVAFDPSVEGSSGDVSTDWGTMRSSSWTQAYSAVPEPSVALMGLLGLGMLLKRRRA